MVVILQMAVTELDHLWTWGLLRLEEWDITTLDTRQACVEIYLFMDPVQEEKIALSLIHQ
jgi:hypothetical protein